MSENDTSKRGYGANDNFCDIGSSTEAWLRIATEERARQIKDKKGSSMAALNDLQRIIGRK